MPWLKVREDTGRRVEVFVCDWRANSGVADRRTIYGHLAGLVAWEIIGGILFRAQASFLILWFCPGSLLSIALLLRPRLLWRPHRRKLIRDLAGDGQGVEILCRLCTAHSGSFSVFPYAKDTGFIVLQPGGLYFEGQQTAFSIPLSKSEVSETRLGIEIRPYGATLALRFDRFGEEVLFLPWLNTLPESHCASRIFCPPIAPQDPVVIFVALQFLCIHFLNALSEAFYSSHPADTGYRIVSFVAKLGIFFFFCFLLRNAWRSYHQALSLSTHSPLRLTNLQGGVILTDEESANAMKAQVPLVEPN